jgi:hypothetical protein
MADADTSSEDAPGEDAPETLPGAPVNEKIADQDVPEEAVSDEAFAEDIAGAEDFSEKALSERTRKAYRRAWEDFEEYCEEVGREPLPARPVTVAAYLNSRARARPTGRGAPEERSGEGLAASTLKQRLAGIKHVHESSGCSLPDDPPPGLSGDAGHPKRHRAPGGPPQNGSRSARFE